MQFNELVKLILSESMWPKNWFKSSPPPPVRSSPVIEPTEFMDVKGWLKHNKEWRSVSGVHARPEYIEWLKDLRPGSVHSVSRDAVDECISAGHTRVTREGGVIHIECRSKQTGETAIKILQSKFKNAVGKPAVLDIQGGDSFELDATGKVIGRTSRGRFAGGGAVYNLD